MARDLTTLIGNRPDLARTSSYAAILGERPSQGARSPHLWNAVFTAQSSDIHFHPLDVEHNRLRDVVSALSDDKRFIGGAVTAPYKTAILPYLGRLDPLATRIGAVNCIYRDNGTLVGTNTDGAAALAVLLEKINQPQIGNQKVLLIGAGGAGAAVGTYLLSSLGPNGQLLIANRTQKRAQDLQQRIPDRSRVVNWPIDLEIIQDLDILVNCSTVGFAPEDASDLATNRLLTPLSQQSDPLANIRDSLSALAKLHPGAIVFDIIYQPRETMLLQLSAGLGYTVLGGLTMNLEQAVIAFTSVIPNQDKPTIRKIMSNVP